MKIVRRYFFTIYDLKPKQIWWRVFKFLFPSKIYFLPNQAQNENFKFKTAFLKKKNSIIDVNKFCFLNVTKIIKSEIKLVDFKDDLLWIYNLNYFDFLNSTNTKKKTKHINLFIERWLNEASSQDYEGWDSYPSSLRIVNCIKWLISNKYTNTALIESIGNQSEKLFNNIEWHLYGNHLIANAKALIYSGIFFKSNYAQKWKKKGIDLLRNQLSEQILKDGGHFEKSPMYHAIILEDLLDIINITVNQKNKEMIGFINELEIYIKQMLNWFFLMTYPKDQLSFFNDTTNGIAPKFSEILSYAKRLGINFDLPKSQNFKINYLEQSGYIIVTDKLFKIILDVGSIGPNYIPGHAHADTLSFEMCFKNEKFIVNSGISTYRKSKQRLYERGTSAHNTVTVNNENSSDVWSSFRVGRKARIIKVSINKSSQKYNIQAIHDGYTKISRKNLHERNWVIKKKSLEIIDKLTDKKKPGVSNFILHPSVKIKRLGENLNLILDNENIFFTAGKNEFEIIKKPYLPEFNKKIDTNCISVKLKNGFSKVIFNWD